MKAGVFSQRQAESEKAPEQDPFGPVIRRDRQKQHRRNSNLDVREPNCRQRNAVERCNQRQWQCKNANP